MSLDVESVHRLAPEVNRLPGEPVPYCLAAGEGRRYELDGRLVTVIATARDTGGLFDAAYLTGGRGATAPFHVHSGHQRSFYVFDGRVQFWLGGDSRVLVPGDSVHVPAGTPVAYRMLAHLTRVLTWAAPGGALDYVEHVGTPVQQHIHPVNPNSATTPRQRAEAGAPLGITFPEHPFTEAADTWDAALPAAQQPYFLRSGEGDRREAGDCLNTYLARGADTGGGYFAVDTVGARAPYIVRHFHRLHTENFVCVSGRVRLHVNGSEVLLTQGDFVHAPAGTIHSFAFDAHNTRMLGVLTPDVFEPFFDLTGRPTEQHVHTDGPADLAMSPDELAAADLDLEVVGPPPRRSVPLEI